MANIFKNDTGRSDNLQITYIRSGGFRNCPMSRASIRNAGYTVMITILSAATVAASTSKMELALTVRSPARTKGSFLLCTAQRVPGSLPLAAVTAHMCKSASGIN